MAEIERVLYAFGRLASFLKQSSVLRGYLLKHDQSADLVLLFQFAVFVLCCILHFGGNGI